MEYVPDSGCFRGAFNCSFAENKMKRVERQVVPKMFCIFKDGAFCGHTPPDAENLVYFFHCCAFVDCDLLENQFSEFQTQWQQHGIISDKFRLFMLRFLEALDLLHSIGFNILDVKFKKFGVDHAGKIMAADLGFSVLHSDSAERLGAPSLRVCSLLSPKKRGYKQFSLRNRRTNETSFFTSTKLEMVRSRLIQHTENLTCLGIGTKSYYDESENGLRNQRSAFISREHGRAEDTFQAVMCILQSFHPPESIKDFCKQALEASSSVETLKIFMKPRSCDVQQEVPFDRFVDVIHGGLGHQRLNLKQIIGHTALLLIVLEPELDRFARGDGICFPGGRLDDSDCEAKLNPLWKDYVVQPLRVKYADVKGLCVYPSCKIPRNTFFAFYAGIYRPTRDSMQGTNSKYVLTLVGNVRASGEWMMSDRFYCDASPNDVMTMNWFMKNCAPGHILNSGNRAEVNCILQRDQGWVHNGKIWFPMFTGERDIEIDEEMTWKYPKDANGQ